MGWTSGVVGPDAAEPEEAPEQRSGPPKKFHIVTSAQGSAVHWQVRVHYYWWVLHHAAFLLSDKQLT